MNKNQIKQLAKLTIDETKINQKVATFVLNKLSRKELIYYIRLLKTIAQKNMVRIVSSDPINATFKSALLKKFSNKHVVFEQNDDFGPGIKAIINDTIMDLSIKNYIDNTVDNLKN